MIRVSSDRLGEFLVLKEFQLRPDPRMPLRMRAYSGLAAERYDCPVYAVVINILPPRGQVSIPDRYESEWLGLHARQDYRVINLWQIEADLVFQLPIPSLLPFVPILQGGGTEPIIRRALNELRNNELMWCLIFPVKQSYSDGWEPLNNRRGDHKPTNELWAGSVPLLGGGRGGVGNRSAMPTRLPNPVLSLDAVAERHRSRSGLFKRLPAAQ